MVSSIHILFTFLFHVLLVSVYYVMYVCDDAVIGLLPMHSTLAGWHQQCDTASHLQQFHCVHRYRQTDTRLTAPFSGTTWVSRHQKG